MELVNLHEIKWKAILPYDKLFRTAYQFAFNYQKQYTTDDYRYNYFVVISELILWTIVQLENFSNHNPDKIIESRFENLTEVKRPNSLQMDTFNRQNFINSAMFISDDFIKSVLLTLTTPSHYKSNVEYIKVNIFENNYEKFKILYTPYLIRNALHNNGYHRLETEFDLDIDDKQFSFKKDKQIDFAGWSNLCIIMNEYLQVIVEMIENNKIKNIKKIEHTFLSEEDTQIL